VSGFESTQPRGLTSIRTVGEGKWTVIGNLTLHGETRSITIDVHNDGGTYVGESRIRQT
jgi:polyisoprenoid-binding protein YceI